MTLPVPPTHEYVILAPQQQKYDSDGNKQGDERVYHAVIGPFATREAADDYVTKAQSEYACPVLTILKPVADPSDDADLNP